MQQFYHWKKYFENEIKTISLRVNIWHSIRKRNVWILLNFLFNCEIFKIQNVLKFLKINQHCPSLPSYRQLLHVPWASKQIKD